MGESRSNRPSDTFPVASPFLSTAIRQPEVTARAGCGHRMRVAVLVLSSFSAAFSSPAVVAREKPLDRSWRVSGAVSLLPGSDGDTRVGYGLTLSRSLSRRTTVGAELTSSFGAEAGDEGSARIHTLVGGFVSQSLYRAQGISLSAGLSAGVALAKVREVAADEETDTTEAYPYVEPKLSASLAVPGGSSRFSGSIGLMTLPGEDFSEPRFSFGFSF